MFIFRSNKLFCFAASICLCLNVVDCFDELSCTTYSRSNNSLDKWKSCNIEYPKIVNGHFKILSPSDPTVEAIMVMKKHQVNNIPEDIGEKFPNLQKFTVTSCSVALINNKHFRDLSKLSILNLRKNEIAVIEPDAFKDLLNLDVLNLGHNKIRNLHPMLFISLINLKSLNLNNNFIEYLDVQIFYSLVELRSVSLSGNNLKQIDENMFESNKKLTAVFLQNTCVDEIYFDSNGLLALESDLKAKCKTGRNLSFKN